MPTVEQVWRQAMPHGTDLVAGEAGIYNEVSWVVTLRPTPPGFDHLRGNELALIDITTVKGLRITLSSLVTSLVEQGIGALGILGEGLPEVRERAKGYKLPILRLPSGSDLSALQARITALITEERSHLYQEEQKFTEELMELALAGQGTDVILDKLQELSGRTVLLLNPDFEPITVPLDQKLREVQKTLSHAFPSPPNSIAGLKLAHGFSAFLSPVLGKQGIEGYLLVVAPSEELQEADRLVAKVGALTLAIAISRRQAVVDTEDKFQVEMLESILNSELSAQVLSERAERLGLDLSKSYMAMAAQLTSSSYEGEIITRKVRMVLSHALCYPRGNILVIIYPVASPGVVDDLRRLGKEVARKLSDYLGAVVSLGIGRSFIGAEGLRVSFQEAERALVMGRRVFGDGSVNLFSDLGVYRLLLSVDLDEVKNFYQESIGRLAEYDRKHSGELLHTLETLLRYSTLSKTAQALYVHRNTLLYRLQRIQEITKLNLEDGETRLMLHLALKAGDVIRAS
ncbi:MAG TPA: helix-turn-helix domain-containing protein [Dehalococcoidia bacterium]|nr:helix-turn-helix domain-containing protein [Dehalococcoidia bacterium]